MTSREQAIQQLLADNERRNAAITARFNPVTGEGSVGERVLLELSDFPLPRQWVPRGMMRVPLVRRLQDCGSVGAFLASLGVEPGDADRQKVIEQFVRVRYKHDFPFWAATMVYIKPKGGGQDVLFRLTRPQRKFVDRLEQLRLAGRPIRLILLKARQWGGSTTSQLYMAWLQLVHQVGLNSLIIAHQGSGSDEIKDMFDRMIKAYPARLLHALGQAYRDDEPKLVGVGKSGSIFRVPQRNCKIKIGTAERPDSCRGGDYNLVHLSEVAFWKSTEGKRPEDIVRSACSSVPLSANTMIVYESTANGVGNFFHREYLAAKDPKVRSAFEAMFISWFDIEQYSLPLADAASFAATLYDNRLNAVAPSSREESGKYLWWLWERGATLEAINWYVYMRATFNDHAQMAAEYPSDDVEAFAQSGTRVFDIYQVRALRSTCREPMYVGEVSGDGDTGRDAFSHVRFQPDRQGRLWIWAKPEPRGDDYFTNRYIAVVDIGGRSGKSDWSVVCVFDRIFQADGGRPMVVAQWYGHIDMDLLAWKAAQIAAYYDNALLVIESNTLETHDRNRQVDGDQSQFVLNQLGDVYPNLYARRQSEEEIRQRMPTRYGFHTNVATKPMVISTLVKVVREGLYVERDSRCLDELDTYERRDNGSFGAIEGAHDDLLMTRAIGLHLCFFEVEMPRLVAARRLTPKPQRVISAATM